MTVKSTYSALKSSRDRPGYSQRSICLPSPLYNMILLYAIEHFIKRCEANAIRLMSCVTYLKKGLRAEERFSCT